MYTVSFFKIITSLEGLSHHLVTDKPKAIKGIPHKNKR
jgi:hypothetical protein